jgi:hypothetical protein
MTVKRSMNSKLIAACGMNCAICLAFLREKNRCEGCWSPERKCNKNCTIDSCVRREGKFCFTCDSFPCKRLLQLDSRYRKKYGMSMIKNLELIQSEGIRNFIRTEKNRWTCSVCGRTICVHRGCCFSCGEKKEKDVF